ncbi:tyrosine-protein kinase BAZ1B-like [Senna tora]|uniref:Tyrosine-protein kinase BAZ1B-like n=1 Tax=Senna tora TaxID=362788 RepID=A0A834TWV7_9FABA|nr:tyrosine-protein kinase BAZ1B-like [Senna tora]
MNTKPPNAECCMCGDRGFSDQLFQCKLCHFRSQHRYCSNLYPKAQSYGTCNWCLILKDEIAEKSPNSSNSSSSFKNNDNGKAYDDTRNKRIKSPTLINALPLQVKKHIKKQRSPEAPSPPPLVVSTRKRIVTNGALQERLRRTNSESNISNRNNGITKPVFRNKVRRYKLLDELSYKFKSVELRRSKGSVEEILDAEIDITEFDCPGNTSLHAKKVQSRRERLPEFARSF